MRFNNYTLFSTQAFQADNPVVERGSDIAKIFVRFDTNSDDRRRSFELWDPINSDFNSDYYFCIRLFRILLIDALELIPATMHPFSRVVFYLGLPRSA